MKNPAYSVIYLDDAMEILGQMFDFVVYGCRGSLTKFMELFTMTDIAPQFEHGHPKYVTGMSGIELTYEVMNEAGQSVGTIEYISTMNRSPEYWCGWALAYYQWYSGRSFKKITERVPVEDMVSLYSPLHEADIQKFVDVMEKRMEDEGGQTKLQKMRKNAGMTQAELAERSGVSLRSIQMYEQQNKDIRKAQVERILHIARALGCGIEDII